jgi:hypothetical protein
VIGSGGASHIQKFTQADLGTGVDIRVEGGSGLPRTRAGRQERIFRMVETQLISPHAALKHLDIADVEGLAAMIRADEEQATREIDKIMRGQPLNPAALQDALAAVQQGINPQTGEAIQSPQEAQQILEQAAYSPGPLDNHAAHLDSHGFVVKSVEFDTYPPEIQRIILLHAQLHQSAMAQPPEPVEPKIGLNIRSTMGPSGTAKLLARSGVDITPEEAQEPPLETAVYDSIDKPDADSAGNDPLDAEDREQQMTLAALETQQKLAQSADAHELDMAQKRANIDRTEAQSEAARRPKPAPSKGS